MPNDQSPAAAGQPETDDGTTLESPVEAYLDELLLALRGHPRRIRHQLAEAEAHLRDSADEGVARGLTQRQAEAEAVDRFGSAHELALAEERNGTRSVPMILADFVYSGWLLGAMGAIAVGISGLLAAITTAAWGQSFTAGLPPHSVLTSSNCTRWLDGTHDMSCLQAATADWAHDTVLFRLVLGILGVLALALWETWRRHRRHGSWRRWTLGLPPLVVDTVALTAFGAAGVWLAGQGIDTLIVSGRQGAGQWLSAAPVALALGAMFAAFLLRDLRAPSPG